MAVNELLADSFPRISDEVWKNQVIKDLKGKDFESTLHSVDENNIEHRAIYRKSSTVDNKIIEALRAAQRTTKGWELLKERIALADPAGESILKQQVQSLELSKDEKYAVNLGQYLNQGANQVHQLVIGLHHLLVYIDFFTNNGYTAKEAIERITIILAIGSSYFNEIAKLRAFRYLLGLVFKAYSIEQEPVIHVEGSKFSLAHLDAHNNLIRSTSQAMAAVIGGCNALYLPSFDSLANESDFGKRMAQNIQRILKEESHFSKIIDPAAGSYYLDNLSATIAEKAWNLFIEWEQKGFDKMVDSGFIKQLMKDDHEKKIAAYQSGEKTLVGVNKYENPKGVHLDVKESDSSLSKIIVS